MPGGGGAGSGVVPTGGTQQSNQILAGFPTDPTQTPAAQFWPSAQDVALGLVGSYNPYYSQMQNTLANSFGGANQQYQNAQAGSQGLQNAGNQILSSAFDPQQTLYNDTLNKVQQQTAAANANSGVGGTPYGQSVANDAIDSFNTQWQNQQLARQESGGQAAQGLYGGAQSLYGAGLQSLAAPGNIQAQSANNFLTAATAATNIGNNQYMLPQEVVSDLNAQSMLGLQAEQLQLQSQQSQNAALGGALGGIGSLAGKLVGGGMGS